MIQDIDYTVLGELLKKDEHDFIERDVVVEFSADELKEKFREINQLKMDIALLEQELKNQRDLINGKIKAAEDKITQISRIGASTGKLEMKTVIPTVFTYENGKILEYRDIGDETKIYHRELFDVDRIIPPYLLIDEKEKPQGTEQKSLIDEIEKRSKNNEKKEEKEEIFNFPDKNQSDEKDLLIKEMEETKAKLKKK